LRMALKHNEFVLYYQPEIDLVSGEIIGLEALLRWQHPRKGLVLPMEFIPLAEETGLILPIGEWVLQTACLQNRLWQKEGLDQVRVAVNISGRQLQNPDFETTIDKALKKSGLEPKYLDLELTESIMMQKIEITEKVLQKLKTKGIRLSIDDFGIGYSSLSKLKRFTINTLKIDRSFVSDVTKSVDAKSIIAAIIAMAHSLKLDVLAEGVETQAQLDCLIKKGCDMAQGFFISRPIPAEKVKALFKNKLPLSLRV